MASRIDRSKDRLGLKPRHEPYWQRIRKGCYIGFRKTSASAPGAWLARHRDDESGARQTHSLGRFDDIPPAEQFDAATRAAEAWFAHKGAGCGREVLTVRDACTRYLKRLRSDGREATANDAEGRFKRWIYSDVKLAGSDLTRLKLAHLKAWKDTLVQPAGPDPDAEGESNTRRAPASINRDLTSFRAALNLALEDGLVASDAAWRTALKPLKGADGRRTLYLDRDQRRALIEAAAADLRPFLTALCLIPLRPGALAQINVGDYDARTRALVISRDKTGARSILLPATTGTYLANLAGTRDVTIALFRRADGVRWNKDSWKGPLKDAAKKAGLPDATTAYSLRHSVITDLVTDGLDLLTTARISGTSVTMIERHYGHLRKEHARKALELLAL